MKKDGTDHVWLSMERIDKDTILKHFPNIYHHCLEEGYDVTKECIPALWNTVLSGGSAHNPDAPDGFHAFQKYPVHPLSDVGNW